MIQALIDGETDPTRLAELAHRRIRSSPEILREALRGRMTRHHRFLLALHLKQIDALDEAIAGIDQEVDAHVEPFRAAIAQLTSIPGIGDLGACVILAEIGHDMSRFPTQRHLISWAGLCPKNDESAGKRRSNRMRKGAPWLKTTLIQCAWAAARKKGSYLQAQFHRLRARRGAKKAIGAVAASMLTAAYHMLKDGTLYQDLGADHFDRRAKGGRYQTTDRKARKPRLRRPNHAKRRVTAVSFFRSGIGRIEALPFMMPDDRRRDHGMGSVC
jgi:transposase